MEFDLFGVHGEPYATPFPLGRRGVGRGLGIPSSGGGPDPIVRLDESRHPPEIARCLETEPELTGLSVLMEDPHRSRQPGRMLTDR